MFKAESPGAHKAPGLFNEVTIVSRTGRALSAVLIFAGSLLAQPAFAENAGNHVVRAGIILADFDFQEFDEDGDRLLTESGFLPGIEAGWTWHRDRLALAVDASYLNGEVDYNGQTQAGAPLSTNTDEEIGDIEASATGYFFSRDNWQAGARLGAGYRHWQRDIQPTATTSGLSETYTWGYGTAGLVAQYTGSETSTWTLHGSYRRAWSPSLKVDLTLLSTKVDLDLGRTDGFTLQLRNQRSLTQTLDLIFSLSYHTWDAGRSNTVTVPVPGQPLSVSITEPRSETRVFQGAVFISARL